MKSARDHQTRNFSSAEIAKAFYADFLRQTFKVGMLSGAQDLDALLREVTEKTGKRQTRAIDCGLTDFPMKSHSRPFQLHLQLFGVQIVKALDRDNRHALLLIACRGNRLGAAALRHKRLTCNAEAARFPICIARAQLQDRQQDQLRGGLFLSARSTSSLICSLSSKDKIPNRRR